MKCLKLMVPLQNSTLTRGGGCFHLMWPKRISEVDSYSHLSKAFFNTYGRGFNYAKYLPSNSFTNVKDFKSPKHLAEYLFTLIIIFEVLDLCTLLIECNIGRVAI